MNAGTAIARVGPRDMGEVLVEMGAINMQALGEARATASRSGQSLGQTLLSLGHVTRADMCEAMAAQDEPSMIIKLGQLPEWDTLVSEKGSETGGTQRDPGVAVIANSTDKRRRCFVLTADGLPSARMHAPVARAVRAGYHIGARLTVSAELIAVLYAEHDAKTRPVGNTIEQSTLQADFDELAQKAFRLGASDIHISATRGRGQIHLRLHGELEHVHDLTEAYANDLCSTIYNTMVEIGSTKDGFNPRFPQDGVIERTFSEGLVRFRYSCLPIAPSGFDVTLRIIPIGVSARRKEMHELGYSPDQCESLERIFSHSSGMILFAGTTGSGKSTSMANMLEKVAADRPGKKIRTVEEPVEYRIPGTYQTPVTRVKDDGRDFTIVLRQLMRADPDIIMVGEIRDQDTAGLAIQAVRSGHLCVSTLHADGAPICYDRLVGMGIGRLDMASVGLVAGLIYQKLVPVLCTKCKVPANDYAQSNPDASIINRVLTVAGSLDGIYFRSKSGCSNCQGRGVTGRTVCAEILRPTPAMLRSVSTGDSRELWRLWRTTIDADQPHVMTGRTAFEHAHYKMCAGLVSPLAVESEFRYLDDRPFDEGDE